MTDVKRVVSENLDVWKTEASFINYIRGGIRRGLWEKNPVKLKVIKSRRKRIPNPNPRGRVETVWGGECEVCSKLFSQKELQVDHKRSDFNKMSSLDDIQKFVEGVAVVVQSDLQLVCKPCHGIISHSQRHGVSFEEAAIMKEIIQLSKSDKDTVDKLATLGVQSSDVPKTKKGKRELLTKLMRGVV